MDNAYRLSVYVKGDRDDLPWLLFRKVYQRRSAALGMATRHRNERRYSYAKFDHATIEIYAPTGESEVIT